MSEYLHLLKKKKKPYICFSRYPTHHPNGDLLTQVCNSSTCLNVTSDSEHSEGASCGLPASGVGGRAGGLSGPLAIFRVSHEAAFPLASSGIWLVRWLLDQATYRAHTHTKAPLFSEGGRNVNSEDFYLSPLPGSCFFLTEPLFQMRALLDGTAYSFTLFSKWFITLRLKGSKLGVWGNIHSKQYPVKEKEMGETKLLFLPIFFSPPTAISKHLMAKKVEIRNLQWMRFLAFKQRKYFLPWGILDPETLWYFKFQGEDCQVLVSKSVPHDKDGKIPDRCPPVFCTCLQK